MQVEKVVSDVCRFGIRQEKVTLSWLEQSRLHLWGKA